MGLIASMALVGFWGLWGLRSFGFWLEDSLKIQGL